MVGASLYMWFPYHYVDIEVRAAIGESCAYIWIPLILHWIGRSQRTRRDLGLAGLGDAGLVLSHLPSALRKNQK